jgi:large subunit ribosomal protein L5
MGKTKAADTQQEKAVGGKKAKGKKKATAAKVPVPDGHVPQLLRLYREEIVPAMMKKFGYGNRLQVPRLSKIVVNMGVGEASRNVQLLDDASEELALITGQKPRLRRARRSVASFKLRQGMPVGCSVTLRGWRMYDFLERLVNAALPRVRDFRGLPVNSFDGRGNYSMGVREQLIFLEIDYNKVSATRGMDITAVTTARTDAECRELMTLFGMPFRRSEAGR